MSNSLTPRQLILDTYIVFSECYSDCIFVSATMICAVSCNITSTEKYLKVKCDMRNIRSKMLCSKDVALFAYVGVLQHFTSSEASDVA